jgi:hypothetical protein
MATRATIRQKKTGRPVKFELTDHARRAVEDYLSAAGKKPGESLFTSRLAIGWCMTPRRYARIVSEWVASIGLDLYSGSPFGAPR